MSAPLCELRGVQQDFPAPQGKVNRVLEDINLRIRQDEILLILGPNGSGKSTLLRLIAGILRPSKGEVRVHRNRLVGLNSGAAMVFQEPALFPWMTVEENVRMVLRARDLTEEEVTEKTTNALGKVGLEGYEEAYPRELSRGSRQRVAVARAIAVDPEILVLDEPFSQVDALTAEALRAELLDIWQDSDRNPSSIVMVSHSIREAVLMADRIVILSGNPSHIRTIVDNPLPRPRDARTAPFQSLVERIHDIITSAELPDLEVSAPSMANVPEIIEPLPNVGIPDLLGLLEFVAAQGGNCDLYQVANLTHVPFESVLPTVKAAEMMDFVDTPRRQVELTTLGRQFVEADMDPRKAIWREQLLSLHLFRMVRDQLELHEGKLSKDELIQEIAQRLPMENAEITFQTIVGWGRFGELFAYREDKEILTFE